MDAGSGKEGTLAMHANRIADDRQAHTRAALAGGPSVESPGGLFGEPDVAKPDHMRFRYRYADTFAGFGPDEMRRLAETKRFIECFQGDRDFRAAIDAGGRFAARHRRMLKEAGATFEPEAMELLWRQPDLPNRMNALAARYARFEDLPADLLALLAPYPELRVWLRWRFRCDRRRFTQKLTAFDTPTLSPEYTAWRGRRIAAVRNELGSYGSSIDHPCFAVEVSLGCSVGCGFCAFDAGRLEAVFDLSRPANRDRICGVANGLAGMLGWPAGHGMLYWNSEPNDNPDYVKLLELWRRLTGATLCTSTARTGEDWIRSLIGFYANGPEGPAPWPRISVLSRGTMRRLHKAFTPLEMRDVTLTMQQKDCEDLRGKVLSGREQLIRRLGERADLRDMDVGNPPEGFDPPQGSVACVSGPLVNMVNRTLKLVSPCYTTLEHRYGYRVFDETTFDDSPEGFEVALRRVIGRSMAAGPYREMPLRWRDDLKAVPQPDGFTLLSPTVRRDFRRGGLHRRTAELIGRGDLTYGQVLDALSEDPQSGPVAAMLMLGSLFDKGYLCELAIARDYRARREAANVFLREPAEMAA